MTYQIILIIVFCALFSSIGGTSEEMFYNKLNILSDPCVFFVNETIGHALDSSISYDANTVL